MRIDDYTGITIAGMTGKDDLISRLKTGDMIRAKVLEITSDDAVLKVFDGIILRAKILEAINAKAGDTITLTVSSKQGDVLYLTSLKSQEQITSSNPEALLNMLEKIQVKPDEQNLLLAAEFLKAGAPVTSEQIEKASELMNSMPGIDAEKAVFLTLKGLDADPAENELLIRLLSGDIKLGQMLVEIESILDSSEASHMVLNNSRNSVPAKQMSSAVTDATSSSIEAAPAGVMSPSESVDAAFRSASDDINPQETLNQEKFQVFSGSSPAASKTGTAASETDAQLDNQLTVPLGESSEEVFNEAADKIPEKSLHHLKSQQQKPDPLNGDASFLKSSENLTKTVKKIRDLFIDLDSRKLASELDVNRIKSQLYEKLKLLKEAVDSSEKYASAVNKEILAASAQIEDTLRLLHRMNTGNILYYQLPINLAGRGTTAELYVMKRQRGKRKLDPHNLVMFISLDTNKLGRVETLLDVKDSSITLNIRTEGKHINEYIKEHIKDLYNSLSACGYKLIGVRYTVIDAASTLIEQEKLLKEIARGNYAKIDYRI